MSPDDFRFEPLGPIHDRTGFSCGAAALDRYFREQARQDIRRHVATVFVLFDAATNLVAGYYTLNATAVAPTSLPADLRAKVPRYSLLPAILIGRLAVDRRYQGTGMGRRLLFDALGRAFAASREIGAMAVTVDAKDESARRFYERYGFERQVDNEWRLFIPMGQVSGLIR